MKHRNLSAAEFKRRKAQQQNPGKRPWWDKPAPGLDPVVAREYGLRSDLEIKISNALSSVPVFNMYGMQYQTPERPAAGNIRRTSPYGYSYDVYMDTEMAQRWSEYFAVITPRTPRGSTYTDIWGESAEEKRKREFYDPQMDVCGRDYYMKHFYKPENA